MGYFQMTRNVEEIFGGVVTAPHQIPFTYTSTNGGETFLSLPFYPITGFVTINSGVQVPIENFELDGNTLNLGRELEPGDVVYCLFDKIISPQDASNNAVRIYKFLSVGGETEFTPDFTTYGVQSLYIDGKYKTPGEDYNYFKTSGKVVLDTALPTGVWVVAEMSIKQNIPALAGNNGASEIGTSSGETVQEVLDGKTDNAVLSSEVGGYEVGWKRKKMEDTVSTVAGSLDSRIASIWEYADFVTDRPSTNPGTWDWQPAFMAAHADNKIVELVDGETYTIKSGLVYRYTSGAFANSARLPFCKGQALINYSTLGNGGSGFDTTKQVDDPAQPAYEAAITVIGASGSVVLKHIEGIMFNGNNNTAAIKLIGCCGIKLRDLTFNSNRYGIVFNNGESTGTFTELCVPEFCRWNGSCLTTIAYEKGNGDTSFHGCGMGEGCYASASSGSIQPTILIGVGCQPYNAPLNANIWRSGGANGPVIRNSSGMNAHFYGNLKVEHSYGQVISTGSIVNFYGTISMWSGYNKGTLRQRLSGGPTGPTGGNLDFSGITTPTTKRWNITDAGTAVTIASYNEESRIMIVGSTWYATFRLSTARRTTGITINSPLIVDTGNCNPITKFSLVRTLNGIQITTVEANTIIVAFQQTGLPDQSSGASFNTVENWG